MRGKAQMSVKAKKILLITGIVFGTILLFFVSFCLSIYFIIHPIKVTTSDNGEIATENQRLKIQIQTLEDEIEHLHATSDKNSSDINPPAPVETPTITTPDKKDETTTNDKKKDDNEGEKTDKDEDFSPNTVVTPEGGYEPEPEVDITIIDISE